MPMALKINIDFVNLEYTYNSPDTQWWVDLSRAIIFGLLFSLYDDFVGHPFSVND